MKLMTLLFILSLNTMALDLMPGRLESKRNGNQIAASCTSYLSEACDSFQLYFLPHGDETQASLMTQAHFSTDIIQKLKITAVTVNGIDDRTNEDGFLTTDMWNYFDHSPVALKAPIYMILTPFTVLSDIFASAPATPIFLIYKAAFNGKLDILNQSISENSIQRIRNRRLNSLVDFFKCLDQFPAHQCQ